MITVISATNRPGNRTQFFARAFRQCLTDRGAEAQLLNLEDVDLADLTLDMYAPEKMSPALAALQDRYVLDVKKFAFFVPEYNGSYPGVLKFFLDGISVRHYARNFTGSYVALVGTSSGRQGNLRGADHLADVVQHMGGWVLPNKLPISQLDALMEGDAVTDPGALEALDTLAEQLIAA